MSAWAGRSREETRGFEDARTVRQRLRAEDDQKLRLAVGNVLDGTCSAAEAAAGQGIPVGRVYKAVKAAREKAL